MYTLKCHACTTKVKFLYNRKPFQGFYTRCNMVKHISSGKNTCSKILDSLDSPQVQGRNGIPNCRAIIQLTKYYAIHGHDQHFSLEQVTSPIDQRKFTHKFLVHEGKGDLWNSCQYLWRSKQHDLSLGRVNDSHSTTQSLVLRSWFTLATVVSSLFKENDKKSLKSSTQHSILQLCDTVSRWLTYKLNSKGPRIDPCDTADFKGRGLERANAY